jgi:glutathione S-transferase
MRPIMTKPRLIYFDFAASRGEECRIALYLAGIDFEDVRIQRADWPALKAGTPFGSLPVLEIPGKPPLGHSNAILHLIGRRHGLHPDDDFERARHEALMEHVEDLRHIVGPTMRMSDETQKQARREELVRDYLPSWGAQVERQLGDGPFVGGDKLCVVDIKLFMVVRWFVSGALDHIPTTVLDHCPKLKRLFVAVGEHPGVKTWFARTAP